MGLFLDILNVPEGVTNDVLEGLYKALSDGHDHGGDGIWAPHESTLIRRLVELFTQRGLDRLDGVKDSFNAWQQGHKFKPSAAPVPAPAGMLQHWSADELALARLYLESLPPAMWTLDDHMLCIDMLVQTYMPADALQSEAEWLAVRAGLMGKVQANMDAAAATPKQADAILAAMPSTVAHAAAQFALTPTQTAVLNFARVRSVENVRAVSETVRHKMRALVVNDLEQKMLGVPPTGASSLQTKLLDAFGDMNRDWRRIAVTEAGEAQLQGFVANLPPGAKVKRVEQYKNACAFCRKIDGVVATITTADDPKKDPDTMIWPGKNNVGRSASPMKRVGNVLVPREPEEMWHLPAGLAHPHCRGRWVLEQDAPRPGDDAEFAKELAAILGAK